MNTRQFLEQHRVAFEVLPHDEAFGASRVAQAVHTPGREVAKVVLLRADGGYRYIAAVLPATHVVDFDELSQALGGARLELASEEDIANRCPDCERGALPPFGSQYAAETIIDASLTEDEQIVFSGSSHREAIRMQYQDYYDTEHPRVAHFARRP
jgi:Ala-tRNA(Pro) deacylase